MKYHFLTIVILYTANAEIYSNKSAITLHHGTNNYFGYSVLLQNGKQPRIVVGAPKDGPNEVGAVFDCNLTGQQWQQLNCVNYTINGKVLGNTNDIVFERNLFGAALSGGINRNDVVMISSPKLSEKTTRGYFAIGGVFKLSDFTNSTIPKYPTVTEEYIESSEYRYGYAEYGFSSHAISSSEFLYGAPGYKHWQGTAYLAYQADLSDVPASRRHKLQKQRRAIGEKTEQVLGRNADPNSLAGYAVTSGKFFNHISYVVGMPNSRNMDGSVIMYKQEKGNIIEHLQIFNDGPQIGEHFGSALAAADLNGDGYDDLLVGAPNYAEHNALDNGIVYVFLSNTRNQFKLHQKLKGGIQCRFGTSIIKLGKITLDNHDAIAIGAPYENGIGAVHVYVWKKDQLELDSKIQFSNFKAFGYSLSQAVDIDSNKVADFVVGDYKSNSIALLKAKTVFYYDVTLQHPTLYADRENESFGMTICIIVKELSTIVDTDVTIEFDKRFKQMQIYTERISSNQKCISFNKMQLNPRANRLDPLNININLQEDECDTCPIASPTYEKNFVKKIPFNRNCKGETCHPKIEAILSLNSDSVVVGEANQYELLAKIINTGDPAFICSIDVTTTPVVPVSVVKSAKCVATPCEYNYIIDEIQEKYLLDFSDWTLFNKNLDVVVKTECTNISITTHKSLRLKYESTFDTNAIKLTAQYDSANVSSFDVTGSIAFVIKNNGPSGLEDQRFEIKIPRISHDLHIIDIYEPANLQGYILDLDEMFDTPIEFTPPNSLEEVAAAGFVKSANARNTISCENSNVQCMSIKGQIQSLFKGGHVLIDIPIRAIIPEILKNYRTTFTITGTIDIGKDQLFTAQLDVADRQTTSETLDIWIIIVAVVAALLVLTCIIGLLYKFRFFNRPTHDKLMEIQNQEEILDGVELRHAKVDHTGVESMNNEDDITKEEEIDKL